ncbi:MAG TPA: sigma 54-interacting transcriptional regulator [Vicinamibacterales bacterium]|nr:sigma 54-interacting transcriptional regulator [Vicinamibacterales bacterium]
MSSHRIPFEASEWAEYSRLQADNDRLRHLLLEQHRAADLAGHSVAIRRVRELIAQVAPSPHAVCLRGEPGVGKSRAARAIHAASSRSAAPFVTVACAAMPDDVADDQLFGPGWAETSPRGPAAGCVGRAAGGTLFFDEVAALGPLAQRRLASLARDRAVTLAGRRVPVDVRLIAASSRNIDELTASGAFGRDLRDEIAAVAIPIPALRDRKVDLPLLADLFVELFSRTHVRAVRSVSGRAMDVLMNYGWPGNVTQLRQAIEWAGAAAAGPVIHHHHLPAEIQAAGESVGPFAPGLGAALEAYERELLQDALSRARGVRSRAARLLLTSERVFNYRLRKYGIDTRRFQV